MQTIRIGGVPEHFNLPWHMCREEGKFKAQQIDLQWRDYPDGTGALARDLREGKLDAAVILTEGVVKEIIAGTDLKIVQKYISTPLIWGIHVAASSPFRDLDDLKEGTAAISRFGSGSHLMAYVNAKNAGWDVKSLKFEQVINLEGAVEALTQGKADYFLWEHFTTKPLVDRGVFRRIGDCPTPWPAFVIAFRTDSLDAQQQTVERMLQVINAATRGFKDIPAINQVLARNYDQRQSDIDQWLGITNWSQDQVAVSELAQVQDQLLELELIPHTLPNADFLHYF